MCKVCTGYHGTSEIEHGLCACTVDNPLAKARGLSFGTGVQTMLYLSLGGGHLIILTSGIGLNSLRCFLWCLLRFLPGLDAFSP